MAPITAQLYRGFSRLYSPLNSSIMNELHAIILVFVAVLLLFLHSIIPILLDTAHKFITFDEEKYSPEFIEAELTKAYLAAIVVTIALEFIAPSIWRTILSGLGCFSGFCHRFYLRARHFLCTGCISRQSERRRYVRQLQIAHDVNTRQYLLIPEDIRSITSYDALDVSWGDDVLWSSDLSPAGRRKVYRDFQAVYRHTSISFFQYQRRARHRFRVTVQNAEVHYDSDDDEDYVPPPLDDHDNDTAGQILNFAHNSVK